MRLSFAIHEENEENESIFGWTSWGVISEDMASAENDMAIDENDIGQ